MNGRYILACFALQRRRFRTAFAALLGVALAALLIAFGASRAAVSLLNAGAIQPPVVAVADDSGGKEAEQAASLLSAAGGMSETVTFVFTNPDSARAMVRSGEASAALLLPDGFFQSLLTGENRPPTLVLGGRPLESALVQMLAESAVQMLAAAQNGISAATQLAIEQDAAADVSFSRELNLAYALWVAGRSGLYTNANAGPTGPLGIAQHYLLSTIVYLALLSAPVFHRGFAGRGARGWAARLRAGGRGIVGTHAAGVAWTTVYYVLMLLLLCIGAAFAANPLGASAVNWPGLVVGVFVCAAFLAVFAFLCAGAGSALSCAALAFVLSTAATYMAGGFVPPMLLPLGMQRLAALCPAGWMGSALAPIYGKLADIPAMAALTGCAACLFALGLFFRALPRFRLPRKPAVEGGA